MLAYKGSAMFVWQLIYVELLRQYSFRHYINLYFVSLQNANHFEPSFILFFLARTTIGYVQYAYTRLSFPQPAHARYSISKIRFITAISLPPKLATVFCEYNCLLRPSACCVVSKVGLNYNDCKANDIWSPYHNLLSIL